MIRLSICILTAAGIALSGCGSGSSGGSSSFAERARDVTNAESPVLTLAQIQQRGESVFGNGNYLSSSRLHVQTDNENIRDTVIDSDCVRTTCTYTVRDNSGRAVANVPVSLSDLEISRNLERLSLQIVCMDVRWRLRSKPGVRRSPVQAVGTIAGSCRDIWSRRLGSAAGNPSTGCVGC